MVICKSQEYQEQEAKNNNLSHAQYLELLAELAVNNRYTSKIKRYTKDSKLPDGKNIGAFILKDTTAVNILDYIGDTK